MMSPKHDSHKMFVWIKERSKDGAKIHTSAYTCVRTHTLWNYRMLWWLTTPNITSIIPSMHRHYLNTKNPHNKNTILALHALPIIGAVLSRQCEISWTPVRTIMLQSLMKVRIYFQICVYWPCLTFRVYLQFVFISHTYCHHIFH